jgi:hypothetical protein
LLVVRVSSNTTAYKCIIFFLGATFCKKKNYISVSNGAQREREIMGSYRNIKWKRF